MSERITITVKDDLNELIKKRVEEGKFPSVSAYLNQVIRDDLTNEKYIRGKVNE